MEIGGMPTDRERDFNAELTLTLENSELDVSGGWILIVVAGNGDSQILGSGAKVAPIAIEIANYFCDGKGVKGNIWREK